MFCSIFDPNLLAWNFAQENSYVQKRENTLYVNLFSCVLGFLCLGFKIPGYYLVHPGTNRFLDLN